MASQPPCRCEVDHSMNKYVQSGPDLREANGHLHNFLATLGHELRSPLDAIGNALRST